jgi:hypothetical protein
MRMTHAQMLRMSADPVRKCPDVWIDLEYLYADSTPVCGASYAVRSRTGSLVAAGKLDGLGFAHILLDTNASGLTYSFSNDPQTLVILRKPVSHNQAPEEGWYNKTADGLAATGNWVWGVLQGDFNEDATVSQIIAGTVLTLVPFVDQAGDIRDVVANLKKLIWEKKYDDFWVWLSLVLTLIGAIPELGSLLKGVLKTVIAKGANLESVKKVFNYFAKGNASTWLKKVRDGDLAKHGQEVIAKLRSLLTYIKDKLQFVRARTAGTQFFAKLKTKIDDTIISVSEVQARVEAQVKKAVDYMKQKIDDVLGKKKPVEHPGKVLDQNTVVQEAKPPKSKKVVLQENKVDGKLAEMEARRYVQREGYEIVGEQVNVKTSRSIREVDILGRNRKTGELKAFEIKSGGAKRSKLQKAKDDAMENSGGTIFGKNADKQVIFGKDHPNAWEAGAKSSKSLKIKTEVIDDAKLQTMVD